MSVLDILHKAESLGVRVALNGDDVRLQGKADAVATIKPEIAAHKPEIVNYLRCAANDAHDQPRHPVADGPFMPWCSPLTPECVIRLLADLRTTIGEVADIERWTGDYRTYLLGLVARQPVSTLADDLAYFRRRLDVARAIKRAAQAVGHACCVPR